ncbi:MAG: M1 family metallopeptidase [Bacteroidota bacterium]
MNPSLTFSRISFFNFIFLVSFLQYGYSQDKTTTYIWDPSYEFQDRDIELYHMNADLKIKPFDTLVAGVVTFKFKTLREKIDSIVFNVPELKIKEIKINGANAEFKMSGNNVVIYPPTGMGWQTDNEILFNYDAKPTEGLYFVGWNDPKQIKRKQIWAHRPNHWLPYAPAIHTVDMAITVDDDYKVFSNGVREKVVANKDNTKTWHYKMDHPHPFFSTCLVIGDYEFKSLKTKRGIPLELWYYPDWEDHFEPTYIYQAKMFEFFEDELGFNYPYELYRQAPVIDYMYGAMETTTSTIYGDYMMVDDRGFLGRNYVNVNAHELAHQWFGNYISHLKNKDVWITESFGTYWAKKFEQSVWGEDQYQYVRNEELLDVFSSAKQNNYSVGHSRGGRERWYPKGSLVLDMLRDVLGDKEFKAVMKLYLESHPYETAETNDVLQAIRKATGRSLEWFFEEWIYRGGEPFYEVSYGQFKNNEGLKETHITVEQIHETDELIGLFKMPVNFEVHYKDGTADSKKQWIEEQYNTVIIPNPDNKEIDFVLFDPNREVIKQVEFQRPYDELIAIAMRAENMIDRYDALLALREFPLEKKKNDLVKAIEKETFHLTKNEIISQLSIDLDNDTEKLMIRAINDADDKVRLAVLQNITKIPESLRSDYEKLLDDSSCLNVEIALENLCNSFPGRCSEYLGKTKDEQGWRGRNIRIKWLEISIDNPVMQQGGDKYFDELKGYTGESYGFETRINSMNALKRLNFLDEEIVKNIIKGISHWNYKIRNAASENLKYFYTQNKFRDLIDKETKNGMPPNIKSN